MERIPRKRIFCSAADYEANPEIARKRQLILDVLPKIADLMSGVAGGDKVVRESKIAELDESARELESMHVTADYLDQFTEGDGRFTEESRNNPEVMLKLVVYEVLNIIRALPRMITAVNVEAQASEFDDIQKGEGVSLGAIRREDLPPKMAEFMGHQHSLNFCLDVLDANTDPQEA